MSDLKLYSKKPSHDIQTDAIKVPPHSIEAEQSVLGGLMLDNHAWDKIVDIIQEKDFYRADHRFIFRALAEMARKNIPFDVLTVAEALKGIQQLENVGGELYLFELTNNTPSVGNIIAYAEIVRERSVLRQLIQVTQEVADTAFNPAGRTSHDLLDEAERKVFGIAEQTVRTAGPTNVKNILSLAVEKIDSLYHSAEPITGLATGYQDLDALTSGLQASDLIVVAGRPSMGKTCFAINIAEHAAITSRKPILIFSMEMPGEQLALRMMSSLGRIDQHRIRTGKLNDDDWPRVTSAVSMLSETQLYIDDSAGLSPGEVRSRARRLAKEHGQLGLIVIDYLQLMYVPGIKENRTAEISEISRGLKHLAKELKVPVIAISQLNRGLEQRTNKRPVMSDLRESGAIEQDADVIMFIYRDEVYDKDSRDKGIAEIIIAKQRNGPIDTVKLTFMGKYTRFENFAAMSYTDDMPV